MPHDVVGSGLVLGPVDDRSEGMPKRVKVAAAAYDADTRSFQVSALRGLLRESFAQESPFFVMKIGPGSASSFAAMRFASASRSAVTDSGHCEQAMPVFGPGKSAQLLSRSRDVNGNPRTSELPKLQSVPQYSPLARRKVPPSGNWLNRTCRDRLIRQRPAHAVRDRFLTQVGQADG
jgi:hypothetical protein